MMAHAMKLAVQAGKYASLAGRMKIAQKANPSSPIKNISY